MVEFEIKVGDHYLTILIRSLLNEAFQIPSHDILDGLPDKTIGLIIFIPKATMKTRQKSVCWLENVFRAKGGVA